MGVIENIKSRLDAYVLNGGNVEDLSSNDSEYRYVKDAKVVIDGKRLSTEEKFKIAGHPRARKRTASAENDIIRGIEAYRKQGGNFNVDVKELPFIVPIFSYIKTRREKYGESLSVEQVLRRFGVEEVSSIYKRFKDVMNLNQYIDKDGFVDSYRKDNRYKNYINSVAETLNIPIAVVVGLIGNQNLNKYTLNVDYLLEVKTGLEQYSKTHNKSFKNLKSNDISLYNKLSYVTKHFSTYLGDVLSKKDVLNILDIEYDSSDFGKNYMKENSEVGTEIIESLKRTARENGGVITVKDLSDKVYYKIVLKANRLGLYVEDYFKALDIEYKGGREVDRFARMKVDNYPYMEEMRKERDDLYQKIQEEIKNKPKEIKFEHYLNCCLNAYDKYKEEIHNFSLEEENIDEDFSKN